MATDGVTMSNILKRLAQNGHQGIENFKLFLKTI